MLTAYIEDVEHGLCLDMGADDYVAYPLRPFVFLSCIRHRYLHSFPTRRSSDLLRVSSQRADRCHRAEQRSAGYPAARVHVGDRKSTRLNSSHVEISYAVFCLIKKKDTVAGRLRALKQSNPTYLF